MSFGAKVDGRVLGIRSAVRSSLWRGRSVCNQEKGDGGSREINKMISENGEEKEGEFEGFPTGREHKRESGGRKARNTQGGKSAADRCARRRSRESGKSILILFAEGEDLQAGKRGPVGETIS